jgi:hypothetical protein
MVIVKRMVDHVIDVRQALGRCAHQPPFHELTNLGRQN